jgi:hypothetical protein
MVALVGIRFGIVWMKIKWVVLSLNGDTDSQNIWDEHEYMLYVCKYGVKNYMIAWVFR